jgi:hypothetical protein
MFVGVEYFTKIQWNAPVSLGCKSLVEGIAEFLSSARRGSVWAI